MSVSNLEEIVENGIIAYSIIYFSAEVMTNLTLIEIEKMEVTKPKSDRL